MNAIVFPAALVFLYMTALFLLALIKKDNSIVDIAWGLGFVLIAAGTFLRSPEVRPRHWLILMLILIWGSRLAIHILVRNRGRGEDFRYAAWRRRWGRWFVVRSYFQIFMLQGLLMLIIAYPIILINHSLEPGLGALDVLGGIIWLVGFTFETVGDHQLLSFKRCPENKGKIMTRGLWRYTRHPNYFGEAVMWWGIFLIAVNVPGGGAALISPLVLTLLLLKVSGVTMLEKKYAGNPEFEAYARRTPAFFPWIPRNEKEG